MYIHGYTAYILGRYTWYILGYTMYIHDVGYTWYMDIPRIFHVYWWGRHIHGIYVVYTRHLLKIGVPDAMNLILTQVTVTVR